MNKRLWLFISIGIAVVVISIATIISIKSTPEPTIFAPGSPDVTYNSSHNA